MTQITPEGLRAARAILKWSTRQLAEESGVAIMTINAIENGKPFRPSTEQALISCFAGKGVTLLAEGAPGARIGR